MVYPKAAELTKFFEGCRYKAYQDSAGIWTIGIGSTKDVLEGMVIDDRQVEIRWNDDIQDAIDRTDHILKVKVNDDEMSTLISQAYNLRSFPRLVGYLNTDKNLYKEKMLLYCKDVEGHYLKGLQIRRISERLLFESRDWKEFAVWGQLKTTNTDMILEKQHQLFT